MAAARPGVRLVLESLEASRQAEKQQALIYRGLAARAEAAGLADLAQRFHELHADEQHHLSRLTARLLELRARPADLPNVPHERIPLDDWEASVRLREEAEVRRYRSLLTEELDPESRRLIEDILAVEERHAAELGGKWTMA